MVNFKSAASSAGLFTVFYAIPSAILMYSYNAALIREADCVTSCTGRSIASASIGEQINVSRRTRIYIYIASIFLFFALVFLFLLLVPPFAYP